MIICEVITTLVYGGAEKLLVNFSNLLAEKHEVHIIYLKGDPKLKFFLNDRIKIHHVPLGWACAGEVRKLVKSLKPDVVHTHLGHADLIGMWACRGLSTKLFCTMHNVYFKWNWMDKAIFFLYFISFKTFGKRTIVSCISKAVAIHAQKTLGVSKANIRINYNCIPDLSIKETKEESRRKLSISPNDFCILTVGRLRVQKSTETLLYAIPLVKDDIANLRLLVVGEGELEPYLKNLAKELNIESNIDFIGSTQTPETYFAAADTFILPSVFEGLPTVVLEAFRASLPVIGSNIDGTNELIVDGHNGLLFEPRNVQQLAFSILKIYESPLLRRQLGESGFNSYRNKYDIRSYSDQMEKLYIG